VADRKLIVEITGDTRGLERALGKAGRETETFGKKMGGMAKTAGIAAGAAAVGGLVIAEKALKAQEETGKLDQAFKNAGMSANRMRGFVDKSEAASRKLGFTNSDTRDALTKFVTAGDDAAAAAKDLGLAQDFARFKGISLADASLTLVRAHAGNLRALKSLGVAIPTVTDNMDALRIAHQRAKTAMTDAEKQTAKNKDAQLTYATVAEVLRQKVGGQAEEFSKSAKGGMEEFHAQMGNLEEQAGKHLLPALTSISHILGDLMGIFGGAGSVSDKFTAALERLGVSADSSKQIVSGFQDAFKVIIPVAETAIKLFEGMALVMVTPLRVIIDLIHGDWSKAWDDLLAPVKFAIGEVVTIVTGLATAAWNAFGSTFTSVFVTPFATAWDAVASWFDKAEGFVAKVAGYIGGLPKKAWDAYVRLFETIYVTPFKNAFTAVANWLVGPDGFVTKAAGFIGSLPSKVADFGEAIKTRIQGFFTGAKIGEWISGVVDGWAGFFADIPGKITDFSKTLVTKLSGIIEAKAVTDYISGVPGKFAAFFSSLPSAIAKAAKTGVKDGLVIVGEMIDGLFGKLGKWVKGILGIASPSKEFEQIGKYIVEGLVQGLEKGGFGLKDAITGIIKEYVVKAGLDAFKGWTDDMWDEASKLGDLFGDVFGGGKGALHLKKGPYEGQPGFHETLGLPGYGAIDQFAPGGTLVYPPDIGHVSKLSGRPFSDGWSSGPGSAIGLSMYIATKTGEYFLTHFDKLFRGLGDLVVPVAPIGTVGPMDQYGVSSHIHSGFHAFAKGGIVTRPTLGLVGEKGPEAVIPLSRGMGPSSINLVVDGRVFASLVRRENGRYEQINALGGHA
jgi:hypothetical protein